MDSFITKWFTEIFGALRWVSAFQILRSVLPERFISYALVDAWVLCHAAVAGVAWLSTTPDSACFLTRCAIVYGAVRVFELVIYNVNVLFVDPAMSADHALRSFRRSLILGLINYGEVLLWFAAFYHFFAARFGDRASLVGTIDGSFYYSILTMATYGDITPQDTFSRWLVAIHLCVALFLTLVVLARFVSLLPRPKSKDSSDNEAG
jgi:hypothetical protein